MGWQTHFTTPHYYLQQSKTFGPHVVGTPAPGLVGGEAKVKSSNLFASSMLLPEFSNREYVDIWSKIAWIENVY